MTGIGSRKICQFCVSRKCEGCSWINTRYPTNYDGKKFKSLKGFDKITTGTVPLQVIQDLSLIAEERKELHELNQAIKSGSITQEEEFRRVREIEARMNTKMAKPAPSS